MSDHLDEQAKSYELLSLLSDGEAGEREVAQACAAWKGQPQARERWHAYQVIGDVMRSETLAAPARSDADFLDAFRARLVQEPVVLAPAARAAAAGAFEPALETANGTPLRRRRWAGPTAVAAGFVMVLGVAMTTFQGAGLAPQPASGSMAQAGPSDPAPVLASSGWVGQEAAALSPTLRSALVADNSMTGRPSFSRQGDADSGSLMVVRDAQLDELLAAHREMAPPGVFAPPTGLVRSVAFEAPQR